ncbi:MAG TPA: anti-sigma factor [Solirubrobacteraceae bacterium]|nr:anti-sigma factor [Solirubrobacteraceae bacterium]
MSACVHRDDAGSYVLHALPDDEHERFDAHLATCEACRREVADLQMAADTLPLAAVQVGPPPELRERIMAVVRSEAELLTAAEARADEPEAGPAPARRRRRRWPALSLRPLPAALAAGVLVAAGVVGGVVLSGGSDTSTVTGTVRIASAPSASASLRLSDDATKLEVRRMPPPPSGKVYQVWLKRPNQDPAPTTALFRTDANGSADVEIQRGRLKGVDQVLVTAEPDGGSMKPTSDPVIVASTA